MKTAREYAESAKPMSFDNLQIYEWDNNWRHKYVVRFLTGNAFEMVLTYGSWCYLQGIDCSERAFWRCIAFADKKDRDTFLFQWGQN